MHNCRLAFSNVFEHQSGLDLQDWFWDKWDNWLLSVAVMYFASLLWMEFRIVWFKRGGRVGKFIEQLNQPVIGMTGVEKKMLYVQLIVSVLASNLLYLWLSYVHDYLLIQEPINWMKTFKWLTGLFSIRDTSSCKELMNSARLSSLSTSCITQVYSTQNSISRTRS